MDKQKQYDLNVALAVAVMLHDTALARELINQKADVHQRGSDGSSLLHIAAMDPGQALNFFKQPNSCVVETEEALFEAVSELENDEDLPPLEDVPPQQQSEETKQKTKTVSEID